MHYNAKITKSEGVYQVFFPDLPNVITFGETKDEALRNAADALNGVLRVIMKRVFLFRSRNRKPERGIMQSMYCRMSNFPIGCES